MPNERRNPTVNVSLRGGTFSLCLGGCFGCRVEIREWAENNPRWNDVLTSWEERDNSITVLNAMATALASEDELASMGVCGDSIPDFQRRVANYYLNLSSQYNTSRSTCNDDSVGNAPNEPTKPPVHPTRRCTCNYDCDHRRNFRSLRSPIPGDLPESTIRYLRRLEV